MRRFPFAPHRIFPSPASATALCCALFCASAWAAQGVSLAGRFGDQALLVIDGGAPRTARIGQTVQGVKLLALGDNSASVEVNGQRLTLGLGAAPLSVGSTAVQRTVLIAQSNGQFLTEGLVNNQTVRMMVDTGASRVTLSREQAQRLGLSLQGGRPAMVHTANGNVTATLIDLATVRVGQIELRNVPAVVQDAPLPFALLGMSFLQRVNLQHDGDRMVLTPRY